MAPPPSYSVAPGDRRRASVLAKGTLAAVIGVALIGLVLVFPKEDLLSRLRSGEIRGDGELSLAYLRNIVRADKKDPSLRLLLAEKLIAAGELTEAAAVLAEASALVQGDADLRRRWGELDLSLNWRRYREAPQSADAVSAEGLRAQLGLRLRAQLAVLSDPAVAFELLGQAREVGVADLPREILRRLAGLPRATFADLLRGGREALAFGYFDDSANLYFAARRKTADADARTEALMLGVKSLLASGQPRQAYEAALRELEPPAARGEINWTLADLALGAGLPAQALGHLRRVVPASWDAATAAARLSPEQLKKVLDVVLSGGDLNGALTLLQAAQIQNPGDLALRERSAQIAEWAGKPQLALEVWLGLLRQEASQRAIDNVLRLSPMLYDDDALLAAWLALGRRRELTLAEVRRVVDVYERLGDAAQALAFLDRLSPVGQTAQLAATGPVAERDRALAIESLRGYLLERAGRSAEAIAALERLRAARPGGRLEREDTFRLAYLYLRRGDQSRALQALDAWTPPPVSAVAPLDEAYFDLMADLAWETGKPDIFIRAANMLLDNSTDKRRIEGYQGERILRHYMERDEPSKAAAVAPRVYALLPQDSIVYVWMEAVRMGNSRADLDRLLAALRPEHRARLEQQGDFLARRAGIYAATGDKTLAAADYRASLARREDTSTRISYWWLLIDTADIRRLRSEVATAGAAVRQTPAFFEVLGASFQLFGEPRNALAFYRRQAMSKSEDYLWLVNYADVLEQAGEAALALRLKRHAFGLLSRQLAGMSDLRKKEAAQALIVRVRLSEAFSSGPEKERLQRLLGAVLRDDRLSPELRRQADDLVVSWAVGGDRLEFARRWLWQKHALRTTGERDYGDLALALAESDVQALDRLMERSARKFAHIDQLSAWRQLGRTAQAATLGTELAQKDPEAPRNEELQQALEDDLLKLASRVRTSAVSRKLDGVTQSGLRVQAEVALTPRLRLITELTSLNNRSNDAAVLAAVPGRDRELRLGARWLIPGGEVTATLTQRSAFDQVSGVLLQITRQLSQRLSLQAEVGRAQRTDDSSALSVAGVQDRAAVALNYTLSRDLTLGAQGAFARYRSQSGVYLGQSRTVGVNAYWYLRREDPEWVVRAGLRRNLTRADGQPEPGADFLAPGGTANPRFFVAPGATALDLSLGYGLNRSQDNPYAYSRGWRPYGEIGIERRQGGGVSQTASLLRLGARGTVAGRDQLSVGVEVRPTASGKTTREIRLQYEWIGDR